MKRLALTMLAGAGMLVATNAFAADFRFRPACTPRPTILA